MQDYRAINIGFGNMVMCNRIVAVINPESAPIRRLIQDARDRGTAIDATFGRRTRAVVITDSGNIFLSAIQPETIAGRIVAKVSNAETEPDETSD